MKYKNSTGRHVFWEHLFWVDGETKDVSGFIPPSVGLDLVDRCGAPNPVLLCADVTVPAGGTAELPVPEPIMSNKYCCTVQLLSGAGVAMRFNVETAPTFSTIDAASSFVATLKWDVATFMIFTNASMADTTVRVWIGEDV